MEHPTWKHLTYLTPATCSKPSPLPDREEHAIFTPNLTQTKKKKKSCFSFHLAQTHPTVLCLVWLKGGLAVTKGIFQPSHVPLPDGAHKEQRFCSLQGVLVWSLFSFPFFFNFILFYLFCGSALINGSAQHD